MGYDIAQRTVETLTHGLPELPRELARGETVPVALWRGDRYGAVLFVRRWKNGQSDSDVAIARRGEDGAWEEPWTWSGGPWIEDPLTRPRLGWDGDPIRWVGTAQHGDCLVAYGAAAEAVAALEVDRGHDRTSIAIESRTGAFLAGFEGAGPATLRPLDREGLHLDATPLVVEVQAGPLD